MFSKTALIICSIIGFLIVLAAIYLLFFCLPAQQSKRSSSGIQNASAWQPVIKNDDSMKEALDRICLQCKQPGMGFALVNSSGISAKGVAGSIVYGEHTPATMENRFHIGSTTKSMTAILIQMLVNEGKLNYDTTLEQALPEISMLADYRKVTVRDLLLSRAGITPFQSTSLEDPALVNELWVDIPQQYPDPQVQREKVAECVLNLPPIATPGTKAVYSNVSWAIAGLIVEKTAGEEYEKLIEERIWESLGMNNTQIGGWPASEKDPDQPRGHYPPAAGKSYPVPQNLNDSYTFPDWMNPAGGVSCSIVDYAAYVHENLLGLQGKGKLLDQKGYETIHSVQESVKISDLYQGTNQKGDISLGYGWAIVPVEGGFLSVAEGSGGTFYATIAVYPALDVGFAAFTNCGNGNEAIGDAVKAATGFDWN
jgi:CubicO group peptidase (beta-lactamase class C family)